MSDVALYFPYVNFPDDAWVKAAALNWPQMGRMRPSGYRGVRDTDTVKQLRDELGFVLDVGPDPRGAKGKIEELFYRFLERYKDELIPRYGIRALGFGSPDTRGRYHEMLPVDPPLEDVHPGKMSIPLAWKLAEAGLLVPRGYRWRRAGDDGILRVPYLAMHRRLAAVYLAVLADVTARENQMTPVTDQPLLCAATSGWTIEAMARVLLVDDSLAVPEDGSDYSHVFAVLALQTVIPSDLAKVPVERIIEARRRLLPELLRYREFLDSLAADFLEISKVPDPGVREAKLRNQVENRIKAPIDTMERELGRLGLKPARAILSLQTLAPPAALGVLAGSVGLPPVVTSAGVVAGCLAGATRSALDQRKQVLASHPSGYLLSLRQELSTSDTVAQIRAAVRRAMHGTQWRRAG